MYHEQLKALGEYIKDHNPYFANGFTYAWQDTETGQIWAESGGKRPVFPEDRLGNMFYLRITSIDFQDAEYFPMLNCQSTGTDAVLSIVMVCVVKDADPVLLLSRITNTLALFGAGDIKLLKADVIRESVTLTELNKADEAARRAALQRLKNQAVISINFTFRIPVDFQALDCLPPICAEC